MSVKNRMADRQVYFGLSNAQIAIAIAKKKLMITAIDVDRVAAADEGSAGGGGAVTFIAVPLAQTGGLH